MRAFLALLIAATASTPVTADLPVGRFQGWLSSSGKPGERRTWAPPLTFRSGGLTVRIEPLPCPPHASTETTCGWEGYNNQASVTIDAPGLAPFHTTTDGAAIAARIAAVRLNPQDPRPGIVIDNDSGGSSGDSWVTVIVPAGNSWRVVPLLRREADRTTTRHLQGEIADFPRDLSGDGVPDFVMEDSRFAYAFGCGACTPRPPVVLSVVNGKSVDLSDDRSVRAVFLADMARRRPACASTRRDRNGACAAYVADAARAGRFDAAWRDMLRHYERPPDAAHPMRAGRADFPTALRTFLTRAGYLTA